ALLSLNVVAQARTLEVWVPGGQVDAVATAAELFEEKRPDIDVNVSSADRDRMVAAIAGGIAPDVVTMQGDWTIPMAIQGLLEPIDDAVLDRTGLSRDDFFPGVIPHTMWKGVAYALPFTAAPHFAIMWNKDVFDQLGLDS